MQNCLRIRPVSKICEYIPNFSKIYEQVMFKQIFKYFETILSKNQCGFRKGFSVQLCLLAMLKKWKSAICDKKRFAALPMYMGFAYQHYD